MEKTLKSIWRVAAALVLVLGMSLVMAAPISGADLTGVTATPTDSTINANTTYTIVFTTVTPLTLVGVTDQIIITFPAGFNAAAAVVNAATTTPGAAAIPVLASTRLLNDSEYTKVHGR